MKKTHLFLVLMLMSVTTSFSQNTKMNIGIEGGPSAIFFWGNKFFNRDIMPAPSLAAGLAFQYNVNTIFSLHTNLLYERKGNTTLINLLDEQGNFLGNTDLHDRLNYLTLPVLARATFGNRVKFFFNGGPYVGFLMSHSTVIEAFGQQPEQKIKRFGDFNTIEIGLTTGLGLTVPLSETLLLSIETRNNLGLTNIYGDELFAKNGVKNNSTILLFGVAYQFGGRLD